MNPGLSLDDISLIPADFSMVKSREDVSTEIDLLGIPMSLPLLSSNMDTVFSPELSKQVLLNGGISVLHRFSSIEDTIKLFIEGSVDGMKPWGSVGTKEHELDRAKALIEAGCTHIVIDVAMGFNINALNQFNRLVKLYPDIKFIVGDFCTYEQVREFCFRATRPPDAILVSVGGGSACVTKKVTGCGVPTISAIVDCVEIKKIYPKMQIILNGGIRHSGDLSKVLALGIDAVIIGRLFAACKESGGKNYTKHEDIYTFIKDEKLPYIKTTHKLFRGSASQEAYKIQDKLSDWRTPEGEEYYIPITGTVKDLFHSLAGGLRSAMSYCNAFNLQEFKNHAKIIQMTSNGLRESHAFGKWEE